MTHPGYSLSVSMRALQARGQTVKRKSWPLKALYSDVSHAARVVSCVARSHVGTSVLLCGQACSCELSTLQCHTCT